MTWYQSILLGIIEGLTEFLPISSTGHLILAAQWMNLPHDEFTKAYEVIIQIGPILVVLLAYRERFRLNFQFYRNIFLAFLPSAALGFLMKDHIDAWLESTTIVAVSLILGGFILLWVDRRSTPAVPVTTNTMSPWHALQIGLFQCLALIPGVSRSGATIVGGLSARMSRAEAAEFSFFLAVPTMAAATGYKLAKLIATGPEITAHDWTMLAIGLVVASIVAALAIRGFIQYVQKQGFAIFGWYRILVGTIILVVTYFRPS